MKYKSIIISNDKETNWQLENLIKFRPELKHPKIFNSLKRALNYFKLVQNKPDMVFIDINNKSLDEMKMILEIKRRCKYSVCFSEHAYLAKDSYDVDFKDFLQTPIITERFNICINRMLKHIIMGPDAHFFVKLTRGDNKSVMLYYKDICVIESSRNYINFITQDNIYTLYGSISTMEKELSVRPEFIRIHKSFIISTDHIDYLQGMSQIKMKGKKEPIPISDPFKNKFKEFVKNSSLQLRDKVYNLKLSTINNQP